MCESNVSCAKKKKQKGGRKSTALTHNKKQLMAEISVMAIAAFWLNIPGKGKMNGEMIFYFPGKGCWWQCVSTREGSMPRLLLNYSFQMKKHGLEWAF